MSHFSATLSDIVDQSGLPAQIWSKSHSIDPGMLSKLRSGKTPCTHERLVTILSTLKKPEAIKLIHAWLKDHVPAQYSTEIEIARHSNRVQEEAAPDCIHLYGFSGRDQKMLKKLCLYAKNYPDVLDWLRATVETLETPHENPEP